MEIRALLLLCCLLTAGLVAVAVIGPELVPAVFRTGTAPGPAVPASPAALSTPVPAGFPGRLDITLTPVPADFPGRLAITSTPPGAEIWLDTDPAPSATTPVSIPLSPITHPLRLRHPGYKDYVTSVTIPSGSTVSLSVRLEPAPADLPGRPE